MRETFVLNIMKMLALKKEDMKKFLLVLISGLLIGTGAYAAIPGHHGKQQQQTSAAKDKKAKTASSTAKPAAHKKATKKTTAHKEKSAAPATTDK